MKEEERSMFGREEKREGCNNERMEVRGKIWSNKGGRK